MASGRAGARAGRGAPRPSGRSAEPASLEITVEANPGELDAARLAALRAAGVNRLSLGAQSTDDRLLRTLGRNHDSAAIATAMRLARAAGFDNVSLDLMFGVPGTDARRLAAIGRRLPGPARPSTSRPTR